MAAIRSGPLIDVRRRKATPGRVTETKDVETVIAILNEVGAALVADETIGPLLRDTPGYAATIRLSSNGASLRFAGRVRPEARPQVEAEARRRIAAAMGASGVQLIRSADLRPPA
jgi:hypothetical protein